jgi:peptidoglycan/LPS O-acetylase OafA/YrhL
MNRLPALDGLRAFAVLAVLGFHYEQPHVTGGSLGVQVFFVLSGWLITTLLTREREKNRRIDLGAFYRRRVLRLMPALVVVVGLATVAALIVGPAYNIGWAALGSILYANDFIVALGKPSRWLDPTWSLAVEFQFYLVWPLALIALLRRLPREQAGRWLLVLAAVMFAVEAITSSAFTYGWTYFTPLGCAAALLAGCGVALCRLRTNARVGTVGCAVLVVACFAAPDATHHAYWSGWVQVATVASAAVVAWLSAADRPAVFSDRRIVWLGERSYGVYLVHTAVRVFLISALSASASVVTLIGVPLSILLAAAMYRYVELPFLRRKRRHGRRRVMRSGGVGDARAEVALGAAAP